MTLVTNPRCFESYPPTSIPEPLLARLRESPKSIKTINSIIIRLQCFCELTGQSLIGQDDRDTLTILNDFMAAMYSLLFRDPEKKNPVWTLLYNFRNALPKTIRPNFPCTNNINSWSVEFRQRVRKFDQLNVDPNLEEFWTGWTFENAAGKNISLKLWKFWLHFGPERTRQFSDASRAWYANTRQNHVLIIELFADHLVTQSEIDFDDSLAMGRAISNFMPLYFRSQHAAGVRLSTLVKKWWRFADLLTNHLLGHAWATPVPAIPLPKQQKIKGATTHIRTTTKGHAIKVSLITPVPMHVTDKEAKELLFRDIRREVDILAAWARYEVIEARERLERRKAIAESGMVSRSLHSSIHNGLRYRLSRECPEYLAHAAATFECEGLSHLTHAINACRIYPKPSRQTAWDLGLPLPALLLAHAIILVKEHPQITPAFLSELELFDADGHQVGLVQTDAGWYLRGEKRRRGPNLAQQEVLLTTETLQVIRDVVEMTVPLRQWLRDQDNPDWRKLFLVIASMGSTPKCWQPGSESHRNANWLSKRFVKFASLINSTHGYNSLADPIVALDLASRFSLKRLRSSVAILVYFETGSAEEMSKALGHANFRPKLLDFYLPQPIQEFFTERWIKLFQTGIICESLRNSPYLLEASDFKTMDELDEFLENHALQRIPAHLENPDQVGGRNQATPQSQIVFSIGTGILTILMSIESAVRTASREPCGRAVRWARISEHLIPHLETQTEQPEFHRMVSEARSRLDTSQVEALIYG